MNGVIYARYSSDNQREESIEGQLRECNDFAKRNDITIIDSYIDRAFSATTDRRPAFQKMIKYVNTIVYDRNIRDGIKMIDNWNNGNVELSLQGSAKKYKITSSIIQKYIANI